MINNQGRDVSVSNNMKLFHLTGFNQYAIGTTRMDPQISDPQLRKPFRGIDFQTLSQRLLTEPSSCNMPIKTTIHSNKIFQTTKKNACPTRLIVGQAFVNIPNREGLTYDKLIRTDNFISRLQ